MIGRLNHVAIAVRDIAKATNVYHDTLGAEVTGQVQQPEHGELKYAGAVASHASPRRSWYP